jgi:hypothetical protein
VIPAESPGITVHYCGVGFLVVRTRKAQYVTDEELRKDAAEWAERTAVEQGLPPRVMDIAVLRGVMRLMGLLKDEQPQAE